MARTQSTNAFTGANNTNYRTTGGTAGAQNTKKKTYRFRRTQESAKEYDPENPFTFWLQGTDKCNADFERQKVADHVKKAATRLGNPDAILLSQFSTSIAEAAVAARTGRPVLTSPGSAVAKMKLALGA